MGIDIKETFEVEASVQTVWRFLMDAERVAACMPGAKLEETVDERTYVGSVKIKVGAITASYKGRVEFAEVDESAHTLKIVAEGREPGGGTAKGSLSSSVEALAGGKTQVVTQASVDLTGRIMQVGRGMIQGVAHQLFLQFVKSAKTRLEAEADGAPTAEAAVPAAGEESIAVLPLLLRTLREAVARFFRRLFGGSAD